MRPGAGRAITGLEDRDWHIHLGQRAGSSKAGLARADHQYGRIGAWSEIEIDIHSEDRRISIRSIYVTAA